MAAADVVVVGGGPVGLAAAIAARLAGLSAVVLERQRAPVDKACGEGILPAGLAALARLGVPLAAGQPFRGIRYLSGEDVACADFPGGELGRGVRRTDLHAALARRAREVGAELRFEERVESVAGATATTGRGEEVRGRYLVGADGLHSQVRAAIAGEAPASADAGALRFGVTRHFAGGAALDRVEVVFGDRAEAYLTPLGRRAGETGASADPELGVAILWSGGKGSFDSLLVERFAPALGRRIAPLARHGRDRGAGPFRQRVERRTRRTGAGGVALVGDAGGYVDALTGEGLSLGFEQAEALGRALAADDLAAYERAARALAATPERLTNLALFVARRPMLRRRFVATLARDPALFSALLGALGARRPLPAVRLCALIGRMALAPAGAAPA